MATMQKLPESLYGLSSLPGVTSVMKTRLRIIVTGLIAQYPMGGVTWDYLQYVLGLSRMGHEVYYLEDTGLWPYNPHAGGLAKEGCEFNVNYLSSVMQQFDLSDNWMYRHDFTNQWYGVAEHKRRQILKTADVLINVSGCLYDPTQYRDVNRLVYIDSDPAFTQIKLLNGYHSFRKQIDTHDVLFTFAENPAHSIPDTGDQWHPTRQPIVIEEWEPEETRRNAFTTVMNWTSYKSLRYKEKTYGQKDVEFEHYINLPASLPPNTLELAVNDGKTAATPRERLHSHGWNLVSPNTACDNLESYRNYIRTSFGEWSVAKNGYVTALSGWFSCRSACYLAAARPVVIQDTGFRHLFPVDSGIAAFSNTDEALNGIEMFRSKPKTYSDAASDTARTYFNAPRVLHELLDTTYRNNSWKYAI